MLMVSRNGAMEHCRFMIKLVTDSGVSLPPEMVTEYGIEIVSGYIQLGTEIIRDYPISVSDFYARLAASKETPIGRDSVVKDFTDAYRKLVKASPERLQILSLHVSEALASTMTMARNASIETRSAEVKIFDTRNVSIGQGLIVLEAAKMIREGADIYAILERIDAMAFGMKFYMLVDTLDYLAKGGRIGSVAHRVGTLLNVKPMLQVSNGNVNPFGQHRSREKGIQALCDLLLNDVKGKRNVRLAVTHALADEDARALGDKLCDMVNPQTFMIAPVSASVGIHTGPGALGIAWYGE